MYDYPYLANDQLAYESSGPSTERASLFVIVLLVPFVISTVAVSALIGFNYVVIALGAICGAGLLMASLQTGFVFPPEMKLFGLFILWSVSGVYFATVARLVLEHVQTLVQLFAMVAILAFFSKSIKNCRIILLAMVVGVLIMAASAILTGEYQRAEDSRERAAGFALNANAFAMALVYGELVLLYFFRTWKSLILKLGVVGLIMSFGGFIIASGSRKGFICYIMVVCLWFLLSYRKEILTRPAASAFAGLIAPGAVMFIVSRLSGTLLEHRLEAIGGSRDGSISLRKQMMHEGVDFVLSHPVFGLGLGNFIVESAVHKYAHNNYVEVFSCTGIVGGLLFYGIYVVLGVRLYRLGKMALEPKAREFIVMAKVFLAVNLTVHMALVGYYDKITWILLALFMGFSYQLQQQVKLGQPVDYDPAYTGQEQFCSG